jgi:hypothetical protein
VTSHRSTSLLSITRGSNRGGHNALVVCPMTRAKTRYQSGQRIDGGAVGLLLAFAVVIGLFILWFYPIAHARYGANPGLAAYQPPPATVIPDMPARVVTEHHQAPPPVEIRSRPEQPRTAAPASTGAPAPTRALASTGVPAAAEALASSGAFASTEPATAAAASRNEHSVGVRKPKQSRPSPPPREQHGPTRAAAYPGYSGGQPF